MWGYTVVGAEGSYYCFFWYLLEVKVVFRCQQLKLLPFLLRGSHQQVVEHMVVPMDGNKQVRVDKMDTLDTCK